MQCAIQKRGKNPVKNQYGKLFHIYTIDWAVFILLFLWV